MSTAPQHSAPGDLTWEVARLFPQQGDWSEEEYLSLTDGSNQPIEYTDGVVEFLPMPTLQHQWIQTYLNRLLDTYVHARRLGYVTTAGTRVAVRRRKFREPDIVFRYAHKVGVNLRYYDGADLVIEIVSDDEESIERDYLKKVADYAEGGISEYWIVDPQKQLIRVLTLVDGQYVEHATATQSGQLTSKLLEGFTVDAAAVFAAGRGAL